MLALITLSWAADDAVRPFGMDMSVGYGVGLLAGEWAQPGVHGYAQARLEAFPLPRDFGGARIGASVWVRTPVWPLPEAVEEETRLDYSYTSYGMHVVFRYDPDARWTGTFGFGFGRIDIETFYGGAQAVPVFAVEGGVRRGFGQLFVDASARGGWGSAGTLAGSWEEWWDAGVTLSVGIHAR